MSVEIACNYAHGQNVRTTTMVSFYSPHVNLFYLPLFLEKKRNKCPTNYEKLKRAQHCYSFQWVDVDTYNEASNHCFKNAAPEGNGFVPGFDISFVLTIESRKVWKAVKTMIVSHCKKFFHLVSLQQKQHQTVSNISE